jgi:hypothetical protein
LIFNGVSCQPCLVSLLLARDPQHRPTASSTSACPSKAQLRMCIKHRRGLLTSQPNLTTMATPAGKEDSAQDHGSDLSTILTTEELVDLTLLIANITEHMRKQITDTLLVQRNRSRPFILRPRTPMSTTVSLMKRQMKRRRHESYVRNERRSFLLPRC